MYSFDRDCIKSKVKDRGEQRYNRELTTRDYNIVDFIHTFHVATTSTISEIFFPSKCACYKRLEQIYRKNKLDRVRFSINNEYIYFRKSFPYAQWKHKLLVTDFYRELHKRVEVINFKPPKQIEKITPDAIFTYRTENKIFVGLLEVEISNKGFDLKKYETFYMNGDFKELFGCMPTVYIVGDRIKLPEQTKVRYRVIKTDFSNFTLK